MDYARYEVINRSPGFGRSAKIGGLARSAPAQRIVPRTANSSTGTVNNLVVSGVATSSAVQVNKKPEVVSGNIDVLVKSQKQSSLGEPHRVIKAQVKNNYNITPKSLHPPISQKLTKNKQHNIGSDILARHRPGVAKTIKTSASKTVKKPATDIEESLLANISLFIKDSRKDLIWYSRHQPRWVTKMQKKIAKKQHKNKTNLQPAFVNSAI
ncbi:hypothetical protein KDA11_00490 [Candidatus Saccharibacteria bacterium]|nr:hypothetical protein [Candidatus Saccharibacteria bacterium]